MVDETDFRRASLIQQPEAIFREKCLMYNDHEIDKIIRHFDRAECNKEVYAYVKKLLRALEIFRYSLDPIGLFADVRNTSNTEDDLKFKFINMNTAYQAANTHLTKLPDHDREILQDAISYSQQSILQCVSQLPATDPLATLWESSILKKNLMSK